MLVTTHRYVLAELNTHRAFSRNSASSRAIPAAVFRDRVTKNPAIPVRWGKNQKGMAASEEFTGSKAEELKDFWLETLRVAAENQRRAEQLGLHKQLTNRLLEYGLYTDVLISSTTWHNFFALRCHQSAQDDIQAAADTMLYAYVNSTPKQVDVGDWHLPFKDESLAGFDLPTRIKICVARAARTSYLNFDGRIDVDADLGLFKDLKSSGHWSPFEHVAQCAEGDKRSGNFVGWIQLRELEDKLPPISIEEKLRERAKISKYATAEYAALTQQMA